MSNDLAKAALPAHLQKYMSEKPNAEDMGHLDSSDIGINMIKLGHVQNKECKRAGWGVTGQEPQIPVGSMFLSRDGKIIPPNTHFIPLIRTVKYIKWIGKPGQDGRIDFTTDNEDDERIKSINGLSFRKDPNSGENLAPLVTKYINFYIMIQGVELPILLSFKRTAIPDGKWLTSNIIMATDGNRLKPFTLVYRFNAPKVVRDGEQDWFGFSMTPAGFTPPEAIDKAAKMYELARALSALTTPAEFEGEEAPAETKAAASMPVVPPTTIQGNATVVQPQAPAPAPAQVVHAPASTVATTPPVQQQQAVGIGAAAPAASGIQPMW
jgi:hypothetical protein